MQYAYRELSEKKCEQLNTLELGGVYGEKVEFDGWDCLSTSDEKVIFTQIGFSHESDSPDQYFLEYNGWYYVVYIFFDFLRLERNGKSVAIEKLVKEKHKKRRKLASDCFTEYEIERISSGFQVEGACEECKPEESEIVEVLKDVIPVWDEYAIGLKYPKERYFTTLCYKGKELLHEYCLREEQRFVWREIDDEIKEEIYRYLRKNYKEYMYDWKSFAWDYGIYSIDGSFFMAVSDCGHYLKKEEAVDFGEALVCIREEDGIIKGSFHWNNKDSGELCVDIGSRKLKKYQSIIEAAVNYWYGKGRDQGRALEQLDADKTKKEYYTEKLEEDKKIYEKKEKRRERLWIVLMIVFFPITIVVGGILYFFFSWLLKAIGKMG